MASIDTTGLNELVFDREELARLPEDVVDGMLDAMAKVIKPAEEASASAALQGKYYEGFVAGSVKIGKKKKIKDGKAIYVTFNGETTSKKMFTKHPTRNAERAFVNEFGVKVRGPGPRPFIRMAVEGHADAACDAAEKIYDDYLNKKI